MITRLMGVAVGVVMLAGCAESGKLSVPDAAKTPITLKVAGTVAITDADGVVPDGSDLSYDTNAGQPCHTTSGYTDIAEGAQVIVLDDAGATLQITSLTAGKYDALGQCSFSFATTVPTGKTFYGIEVTHRGVVKEAAADMGDVALTLGS